MTGLHIFDLDGTRRPGSTASLEIAAAHGSEPQLRALEARFTPGDRMRGVPDAAHTALG